jgi:multiple sugar transport system substrate-binding protein
VHLPRTRSWLRLGVSTALVTLIGGAAAGVSQGRTDYGGTPSTAKVTTITLAHWSSSPVETAALKATEQAFQRAFPSIKVNDVTLDPYVEGMLARFAARKPPDIFYVDSSVFPDWRKQGLLEPLNARMVKAKFSPKPFYQRLLAGFRDSKGTIYGFPKDWSPLALEVNTKMMAAAGIKSAPQTWTQFRTDLQKLKAAKQPPACLSVDLARILAFMFQNKGGFLNSARTKATVNTPANAVTVNTYFGWIQSGLARTQQQLGAGWCGEALGKGLASMIFEGNWVWSFMKETYPTTSFAVWPMLKNKQHGNLGFTAAYSIAKDSKHKAEAFKMLTFLAGPKGMGVWTKNVGYLPSRTDVKPPAGRAIFLKEAGWSQPWQFAPGFTKVIDVANNELTSAFEGKESIDVALKNIQNAAASALRG